MRLSRTSTLTALLAVTVTAASTGTAQAVDPNSQAEAIADQISDIAPGVEIATALDLGESLLAAVENGYVSVPNSPAASVNITPLAEGVPDLAVSLPQLEGAASARHSDDGTVVYTSTPRRTPLHWQCSRSQMAGLGSCPSWRTTPPPRPTTTSSKVRSSSCSTTVLSA